MAVAGRSLTIIPPELLEEIFFFACTDAGQTGCSINLVCKQFRKHCIRTGVDIRQVYLCGPKALECFYCILVLRELEGRKVVSLCMHADQARPGKYLNGQEQAQCDASMVNILRAISPDHLRLLYLKWPHSWSPHPMLPTTFPSLSELYVSGADISSSLQSGRALNLKILHIAHPARLTLDFGSFLAAVCPGITHLHLRSTGIQCMEDDPIFLFMHSYRASQKSLRSVTRTYTSNFLSPRTLIGGSAYAIPPEPLPLLSLRQLVISFPPLYVGGRGCGNGRKADREKVGLYWHVATGGKGIYHSDCTMVDGLEVEKSGRFNQVLRGDAGGRRLIVFPASEDIPYHQLDGHRAKERATLKAEWLDRGTGVQSIARHWSGL
ncbi:hypothetical protein EIP91_010240 [Steccherinum ochraceum]|uniref:F-box domain-containing protein n=1 Tax=Steccherinum ochraceum TaxID=92696 RepID=A0A4V2MUY9_9APHY|nr:hypothetical protein EIP91_010240 [Steccherinum ochraceum]